MDIFQVKNHGNKASDYYFIVYSKGSKGGKRYYSNITNKVVAKKNINNIYLNDIKEQDQRLYTLQLINEKAKYTEMLNKHQGQLNKTKTKINILQNKIDEITLSLKSENIDDIITFSEKNTLESNKRKEQFKKEQQEEIDELLKKYSKTALKQTHSRSSENILLKYNIISKKDWHKWLLKNHPDRGGDINLCQEIISTGRLNNW